MYIFSITIPAVVLKTASEVLNSSDCYLNFSTSNIILAAFVLVAIFVPRLIIIIIHLKKRDIKFSFYLTQITYFD